MANNEITWRDKLRPREKVKVSGLDEAIDRHLEQAKHWQKVRRAISEKARKRVVREDV